MALTCLHIVSINTTTSVPVRGLAIAPILVLILIIIVVLEDSPDIFDIGLLNYIDLVDDIFLVDVADTGVQFIHNIFGVLPVYPVLFVNYGGVLGLCVTSIVLICAALMVGFANVDVGVRIVVVLLLIGGTVPDIDAGVIFSFVELRLFIHTPQLSLQLLHLAVHFLQLLATSFF